MSILVKGRDPLVVPPKIQRQAGIKIGDRVKFMASPRTITIKAVEEPTYKPTKAELSAIQKGEAELARGDFVTLPDLVYELDRRRKGAAKATRKAPR
jgi:predicted transcriptional regulator